MGINKKLKKYKEEKEMEKMKYVGSWSANNGSTYRYVDGFNNLKEARKVLRENAMDNSFKGDMASWSIKLASNGEVVLSGQVRW